MWFSYFNKKSIKNLIMELLFQKWPLTARQVYYELKKKGANITYQAVHKSLLELQEQGLLTKNKFSYQINPLWLKDFSSRISMLENQYYKKNIMKLGKNVQILTFNTIQDVLDFVLSSINTDLYGLSNELVLLANKSYIFPLTSNHKAQIKKFQQKHTIYILISKNTLIDRLAKHYLQSLGINANIGVNIRYPISLFVYGDCIVYIHTIFSKEEMFAFDRLFKANKSVLKENLLSAYDKLLNKRLKTKLVIVKDKDILKIVKIGIIQIFRENNIKF